MLRSRLAAQGAPADAKRWPEPAGSEGTMVARWRSSGVAVQKGALAIDFEASDERPATADYVGK